MSDTLKANKVGSRSRRPKTYTKGRVCAHKACDTRISQYNKAEFCYTHAPARYPRLRGVVTES